MANVGTLNVKVAADTAGFITAMDAATRNARLALIAAARQVLRNALSLLGVSAPEAM